MSDLSGLWTLDPGGKLHYSIGDYNSWPLVPVGQQPGLKSQIMNSGPQSSPTGTGRPGEAQFNPFLNYPGTSPAGGSMASNLAPSSIGTQENLLDKLFSGSVTGQGGGPIAQQLFSLGQGILPKPMQDMITATTNDQFGKLGARFGTDLATAISRGLGQAGSSQSLSAINDILGLGGTTTGFEFQRSENSLNRALQEFLQNNNNDLMTQILPMLLGGGLG